jgi:hypothetical protein
MLRNPFTMFLGAFLLVVVQLLLGKYFWPWCGGTPAMWNRRRDRQRWRAGLGPGCARDFDLNEEKTIAACIDRALAVLESARLTGEVVVADGSSDGSVELAPLHGARVVHARVRGYGSASARESKRREEFIIFGGAPDF